MSYEEGSRGRRKTLTCLLVASRTPLVGTRRGVRPHRPAKKGIVMLHVCGACPSLLWGHGSSIFPVDPAYTRRRSLGRNNISATFPGFSEPLLEKHA